MARSRHMKRERNKTRDAPQAAVWITAEQDSGWSELPGGCVRWGFRIAVSGTQTKVLQTPRQESLRELGKKKFDQWCHYDRIFHLVDHSIVSSEGSWRLEHKLWINSSRGKKLQKAFGIRVNLVK